MVGVDRTDTAVESDPPGAPDAAWSASLPGSFDGVAAAYARFRPGYPDGALGVALPAAPATVLDLAAGTGKLTEAARRRGLAVVAVEPLAGMRAELARLCPDATVLDGVAESIPLPDAAVDGTVVGQAFHWFDARPALDEMARVTRPGGSVALLWNRDDETDPLVAELQDALHGLGRPHGGATGGPAGRGSLGPDLSGPDDHRRRAPFVGHPLLSDPELTVVGWTWRGTVDDLLSLVHTYSYVIRASESARAGYDRTLRELVAAHRPGAAVIDLPVTCQVWRSTRRRNEG